jgi:hypothetical protein
MQQSLKSNERELIKLIKFFRKRADQLIQEGQLSEEHQQLGIACEKLTSQIFNHASIREQVTAKRDKLRQLIKDNAACPKCQQSNQLKLVGSARHEKGWKSNKYKCRRCNIEFVWGKPNNPWDMVTFLEQYIGEMEENVQNENLPEEIRQQSALVIEQLQHSLAQLKPVLEGSDQEMADLETTEVEMSKMIHQFTNYLLIEKIKLNTWQDPSEKE